MALKVPRPKTVDTKSGPATVKPATAKRKDSWRGRSYTLPDGTKLKSVTTILNVIGKPALVNWAANVEREAVVEASRLVYERLGSNTISSISFEAALLTELTSVKSHRRQMENAAAIGTLVHARIEWELRTAMGVKTEEPRIPEEHLDMKTGDRSEHPAHVAYRAYKAWADEAQLKPLAIEQQVYSLKYKYAGTMDVYGECYGARTLLDWKTGKSIYDEAKLQNAAYRHAWIEMEQAEAPIVGLIVRLPKMPDDPGFETLPISWDEQERLMITFRAAKYLSDWSDENYAAWKAKND